MPVDHRALRLELVNDPNAYGYAAFIGPNEASPTNNYATLAAMLNHPRDGATAAPAGATGAAITLRRPSIAPEEVLEAIDVRDFVATPTGVANQTLAVAWFESASQVERLRLKNADGTNTRVLANLNRMVGDTQGSQTRLGVVANYTASRAQQLNFGAVTPGDVQQALWGGFA